MYKPDGSPWTAPDFVLTEQAHSRLRSSEREHCNSELKDGFVESSSFGARETFVETSAGAPGTGEKGEREKGGN